MRVELHIMLDKGEGNGDCHMPGDFVELEDNHARKLIARKFASPASLECCDEPEQCDEEKCASEEE